MNGPSPRTVAVLQALLVTFLWSTSWVFIKIGLESIPPLAFAGLRYSLAFACLLPLVLLRRAGRDSLRRLSGRRWAELSMLGVVMYALTQGAQFFALAYLPAATASLVLSFTPVLVAFLGISLLSEKPTGWQWAGAGLYLCGALTYLYPFALPTGELVGLAVIAVGLASNAGASVLGRAVNRRGDLDPLAVTAVSMGVGSALLLATGLAAQGLPPLTSADWPVVAWLAVVNTAFAFVLWNRTLRRLTAVESSVTNNTMLVQISILAWVFLGEDLSARGIVGLVLATVGALIVQLRALPCTAEAVEDEASAGETRAPGPERPG